VDATGHFRVGPTRPGILRMVARRSGGPEAETAPVLARSVAVEAGQAEAFLHVGP
jgi:hypothetical protein